MLPQQQLQHRVKAPVIIQRAASADNEKPLCSFYSNNDKDDRFATYNSVTQLLRKLAKTASDVVAANVDTNENTTATLPPKQSHQLMLHTILTDSNVCQTVHSSDTTKIIEHTLQKDAATTSLSHMLFVVLRMVVATECIRQEGWKKPIPLDILEDDEQLLLSPDDTKAKSILKVFNLEALNGAIPPQITMESFSRELRVAERRIRMLSLQTKSHGSTAAEVTVGMGQQSSSSTTTGNTAYTVDSFVDRSQVNLMESLPVAIMTDKTLSSSSLQAPAESPRAAEILNTALRAMPNNAAIQASLKKVLHGRKYRK